MTRHVPARRSSQTWASAGGSTVSFRCTRRTTGGRPGPDRPARRRAGAGVTVVGTCHLPAAALRTHGPPAYGPVTFRFLRPRRARTWSARARARLRTPRAGATLVGMRQAAAPKAPATSARSRRHPCRPGVTGGRALSASATHPTLLRRGVPEIAPTSSYQPRTVVKGAAPRRIRRSPFAPHPEWSGAPKIRATTGPRLVRAAEGAIRRDFRLIRPDSAARLRKS